MTNKTFEILCYVIILVYGFMLFLYPESMAKKSLHLKSPDKTISKFAIYLNKYGGLFIILFIIICIILTLF